MNHEIPEKSARSRPGGEPPQERGRCTCTASHERKRIVVTGGPGAGKTAILAMIHHIMCEHVVILQEAAGVVFGGGFPRDGDGERARAAQRAIYHVQRELEAVGDIGNPAIVLCDRGTVDGAAYWPGPGDFWKAVGTTAAKEKRRYDAVIHVCAPRVSFGYNRRNPLRIETPEQAHVIDARIRALWAGHPNVFEVAPHRQFLDKAQHVVAIVQRLLPKCCAARKYAVARTSRGSP